MATKAVAVEVPQISIARMEITLVGDSLLITHAWSPKAKRMMLEKQMKAAKQAKEAKDPWEDFCDSLYWLSERPVPATPEDVEQARFGIPVVSFKNAAVGACRFVDGAKMTEARGAFHISGEFAEIHGSKPVMREDMVRVGMGVSDIRYRGQFDPWWVKLSVTYNDRAMSPAQIINLFNTGGFGVGVGEWRPERDGSYGRFHVAQEGEIQE